MKIIRSLLALCLLAVAAGAAPTIKVFSDYAQTNRLYDSFIMPLEIPGQSPPYDYALLSTLKAYIGTNANIYAFTIYGSNVYNNYLYTTNITVTSNAYFYQTNFVAYNFVTNLTVVNNAYLSNVYVTNLYSEFITNNIQYTTNLYVQNLYSQTNRLGDVVVTNGITNFSLTADTVLKADANQRIVSIPNGSGSLTNDGSGNVGWAAVSSGSQVWTNEPDVNARFVSNPIRVQIDISGGPDPSTNALTVNAGQYWRDATLEYNLLALQDEGTNRFAVNSLGGIRIGADWRDYDGYFGGTSPSSLVFIAYRDEGKDTDLTVPQEMVMESKDANGTNWGAFQAEADGSYAQFNIAAKTLNVLDIIGATTSGSGSSDFFLVSGVRTIWGFYPNAGTPRYLFDTVSASSDNLMEVNNFGTNKVVISANGVVTANGYIDTSGPSNSTSVAVSGPNGRIVWTNQPVIQDITIQQNLTVLSNVTVKGAVTVNNITITNGFGRIRWSWAGPTNSILITTNKLYYTTSGNCAITNWVGLTDQPDWYSSLTVTNSAATASTFTITAANTFSLDSTNQYTIPAAGLLDLAFENDGTSYVKVVGRISTKLP